MNIVGIKGSSQTKNDERFVMVDWLGTGWLESIRSNGTEHYVRTSKNLQQVGLDDVIGFDQKSVA